MANAYTVGQKVRVSGTFTLSGVNADPTIIRFEFRKPGQAIVTYTYGTDSQLVKDTVGQYHVDLSADVIGIWWYRFEGTGVVETASEAFFEVQPSELD